ncbi:flagellar hook-length control protein FliK [Psychromonas antarctica]|uniref:flagellar hook-length control protein FliK n=1 Tax=Psychromonas antarctica TaxID=67573 RepID=UPI001EE97610|nr:flagellar hook-length control protein FliK [Psychromonas antarctica]MCG6199840.1 flagellar hook-length control protein FliK [Psychromonas antarctica]
MMQSILATSPVKVKNSDGLSEVPLDSEVRRNELRQAAESGERFTDLFDSLLAGNAKGKKEDAADGNIVQEAEIDSALLLDSQNDDVDSEALAASADLEFINSEREAGEAVAVDELPLWAIDNVADSEDRDISDDYQEMYPIEPLTTTPQNKGADKVEAHNNQGVDQSLKANGVVEGQNPPVMAAQPAIIAQIEAAQKVDTQVTDAQKTAQVSSETPELGMQVKKEQEKPANKLSESSLVAESLNVKGSESEKNSTPDPLKAEMTQVMNDKIESFSLAHRSEGERNLSATALDGATPRAANVELSSLSKAINQNIQSGPTSSAQQQPLDLQAKHASALLGERILMMIGQGKQEVQIRLDPAELGSMHIKLHVQQDQLHVAIQTQIGQSRDLIEQNLPKLREQLAQQGINLGETSVEQQNQNQNQNQQGRNALQHRTDISANDSSSQAIGDKAEWIATKIPRSAQGIDYYA